MGLVGYLQVLDVVCLHGSGIVQLLLCIICHWWCLLGGVIMIVGFVAPHVLVQGGIALSL